MKHFFRKAAACLALILAFTGALSYASAGADTKVTIDGKSFGDSAVVINGTVLVSMDGLKKTMELEAAFDSKTQSAVLKKNNTTVQFIMQKSEYKVNENSRMLKGSAPMLLSGSPMLPLRAVAEAYGGTVTWMPENKTVVVSFQKAAGLPALAAPKVEPVDGFQVVTIGTSGPPLSPTSTWSSTLVQYQDKLFLVDCGGGATYGLLKAGIAPSLVKNMLFTHHHADHDTDYFTFAIGGWNGPTGRRALNLVGPAGTTELHQIMMDYYKEDLQYRIQYSFPPQGIAKNVFIKELNGPETFALDGVSISTAQMTHTIDTFAYRFDAGGQSVVVSGDTTYDADLAKLAKNADILVIDAHIPLTGPTIIPVMPKVPELTAPEGFTTFKMEQEPDTSSSGASLTRAHATMEEIAKMAKDAGVKKLILTHLPPSGLNQAEVAAFFKASGFEGTVIVGETLGKYTVK